MPGEPSPTETELNVLARRGLLDALEILAVHKDSFVVVGAQAIYLVIDDPSVPVDATTRDADLAVDARSLAKTPAPGESLGELFAADGFRPGHNPGIWIRESDGVEVDLLVPARFNEGKAGTRGARLEGHGRKAGRITPGMEGAVIDFERRIIPSLEPDHDPRRIEAKVAGPAALLVSKLHKLRERQEEPAQSRLKPKDALDVFRILRGVQTATLARSLERLLRDPFAGESTRQAVEYLAREFRRDGGGARLAADSVRDRMPQEEVIASCDVLLKRLLLDVGLIS